MPLYLSPVGNDQSIDANGDPNTGGWIETYLEGSSTPAATFTDATGGTPQSNPIYFNSLGYPTLGAIWLTGGIGYKFIYKNAAGATLRTIDNIVGVNDASVSQSEWVESGFVPTYIGATSFSVPGDQTAILQINRRTRTTNTSGFIYSTISNSVFAAGVTTVTLVNSAGVLDAGLSAVAYSLLSSSNDAIPGTYAKLASPIFTGDPRAPTPAEGDDDTSIPTTAWVRDVPLRNYIDGLIMSTAGSSATMSISAGQASESTNIVLMNLAASISKTTSAWAVGSTNGGIDTGAVANSTWYHWYLIRRPDTGVVDAIFSLSASAPTLPANYTQYRRIGSGKTNGSAQWTKFTQQGNDFKWTTPAAADFNGAGSTSASSLTVNTPTGIKNRALLMAGGPNANGVYISSLDDDDVAPDSTNGPFSAFGINAGNGAGSQVQVWTNTSAQIRRRALTTNVYLIQTVGWTDLRGKDA